MNRPIMCFDKNRKILMPGSEIRTDELPNRVFVIRKINRDPESGRYSIEFGDKEHSFVFAEEKPSMGYAIFNTVTCL